MNTTYFLKNEFSNERHLSNEYKVPGNVLQNISTTMSSVG